MKLIIIGEEKSKRTDYFRRAAESHGILPKLLSWDEVQGDFDVDQLNGAAVKIDPPSYQTVQLSDMGKMLSQYRLALQRLGQADCSFLNSPDAICQMLDKRGTKQCLQQHGIAVTQMFVEEIMDVGQLIGLMRQRHCYALFIKPRYFSGAAGVAAFRLHPVRGKMTLYTSCRMKEGQLINTKRLFRMEDTKEITQLLNELLALECIVERWHPKADYHGRSYDLRVVYQFGHIAHIVVRQSKGPITNLHLNNQALEVQALGLSGEAEEAIEALCGQALARFSGLAMAGIDILLEKGTNRPLIIEINGQGDLIYQDIYARNTIYREQVRELCKM